MADITYLAGNYFGRPNYLRIDGKPVLFVYLTRVLSAKGTLWKALAHGVDVAFLPGVTPGFNDRGVRDGHIPLSRRLAAEQDFGSLFRAMVRKAKQHVDERANRIIMVTSWNEWHEDTQIEPVQSAPPVNSDDSQSGTGYTAGLYYEGYGQRYLAILREETDSS